MSYTILQSTKVFHLVDQKGLSLYISGTVSEDNNVSPKRYDTIQFIQVAKNQREMTLAAVRKANAIMTGSIQLKNGNGKTKEDDVNTLIRRFLGNINKAKTIFVEKITFHEKDVSIIFGETGVHQLKLYEPKFDFYDSQLNGERKLPLVQENTDDRKALNFLLGSRSIEEAIELSKTSKYLPSLFKAGTITEDQFLALITNLDQWEYDNILRRTDTRLDIEVAEKFFKDYPEKFRYIRFKPTDFAKK